MLQKIAGEIATNNVAMENVIRPPCIHCGDRWEEIRRQNILPEKEMLANGNHHCNTPLRNGNNMNSQSIAQFKEELRRLKQDAIDDLGRKMDDLIERADFTTGNNVLLTTLHHRGSPTEMLKRRPRQNGELPEKEFVLRNSVLTDLFTSRHIQTIQHIVIAGLLLWVLATAVSDFFETQSLSAVLPGPTLIENAFVNYHIGLLIWLKMQVMAVAIYPITMFWAMRRERLLVLNSKNFDRIFMVGYVCYQLYILFLPYRVLFAEPILGPATAAAVSIEQIRFMMKIHSFFREVTKKIRRASSALLKKTDGDPPETPNSTSTTSLNFPGFSRYLYFLFAPTLVYRDVYPRTEATDWYYVFSNFTQVLGCILFAYYIMARYLQPEFAVYPPHKVTVETLVTVAFRCILPGTIILVSGFFGFLHSWLNAWAEMLRFGDRLFYKDWWNVSSFAEYYRTWNCVVHDWLYTYIYKDTQDKLKCKKIISAFLVFSISAFFHEYIIISVLKFFFPFLLLQFGGPGFLVAMVRSDGRISNVFVWACFTLGLGMCTSMYAFEMSARSLCQPSYDNFFFDAVVPRFVSCMQGN